MFKHFKFALLLVAMVLTCGTVMAQQMPAIPVDKEVKIGKLPNGLTYYIRHNEKPKGQADFYIAQKVGSVLEEDNQRGLAHFLEHMCFNGTTHFPGSSLRDWLETIGVKFGANLNASTGFDETIYNIANVPVDRTGVQDSCLLILHDWANDLLLEPEEIEAERGVIHQEWRRSQQGTMRILENLLPVIYPDNKYGVRLPIGTMEVVDNFPPQALRDYYETWYRPDQQGIIVVGDIDVDYIENKIIELFSDIEMPENPKERVYPAVADNEETIYAIGSDPEQTQGIVSLMIKTDATPNDQKTTYDYLIMKYLGRIISMMLNQRLDDIAQQHDAPFTGASASLGQFFVSKTKYALDIEAVAKGEDLLPAYEVIYRELLRAKRGGFTVGEYERATSEYLSRLDKIYNSRDSRDNDSFVQEYIDNFTDNEPIPSLEDEYEFMKMVVPNLPVEVINSHLPELITDNNRVIMALYPDNDTFKKPTVEDFKAITAKVDAEDIEPYKDEMKEEPLIPELPAPGKIVKMKNDKKFGTTVLTLSNGVTVVVKTTDFKKDDIRLVAVAKGGSSVIGDDQAINLKMLDDVMDNHGLGDYTAIDLKKYLQGKQVGVDLSIGNYSRTISGTSTVKDLPTLMELLYMTFIDYNVTNDEFKTTKANIVNTINAQQKDPQFQWLNAVMNTLFSSEAEHMPTVEEVEKADLGQILSIVHNSVANAADYTFIFVGDIDMDTFKPLVEQYIATLPANAKAVNKNVEYNMGRELATGNNNVTVKAKMETPQTYCFYVVDGEIPFNTKNSLVASAASQILTNRLLKKIREEMGAVYSISAVGGLGTDSKYNAVIQIPFPMKPDVKDEVLAEINSMLQGMTTDITEEELQPIREYMLKNAKEALELNGSWLSALSTYYSTGVDTLNGKEKVIKSLTTKDVMKYMSDLLKQGNTTVVILDPEE